MSPDTEARCEMIVDNATDALGDLSLAEYADAMTKLAQDFTTQAQVARQVIARGAGQ